MSTKSHHFHLQPHLKDISIKLQSEVDSILVSVDETTIHAEFKEIDLIDIENGVEQDVQKESLDARIQHNIKRRAQRRNIFKTSAHTPAHHVHHSTHSNTHHKKEPLHSTFKKYLDILFKPFEL